MSKKTKWLFIVILSCFFWTGNHLTPYLCDDYSMCGFQGLSFFDATIHSISSAKNFYLSWGGSPFFSIFQRFFMNYPKWLFNIANTFHFALFLCVYINILGYFKWGKLYPPFLILLALLLTPVPFQNLLWVTGSIAYFWPMVWGFVLLYFYEKSQGKNKFIYYLIIPILALFCGNAPAAVGGITFLFCLGYLIYWKFILRQKLPVWGFLGCFCSLLGIIIMVCSPGLAKRSAVMGHSVTLRGIVSQTTTILQAHSFLISLLAVTLFVLWYHVKNHRDEHLIKATLYGLVSFAGLGALLVVPAAPRATLFFPLVSVMTLGIAMSFIPKKEDYFLVLKCIFFIVVFMFSFRYLNLYRNARVVKRVVEQRESHILAEKAAGRMEITVPNMTNWYAFQGFAGTSGGITDLGDSPESWQNIAMAKFYGVEKIISEEMR